MSPMLKPADEIQTSENPERKNDPADAKQSQVEKEEAAAVGAAENEGLPVVGLGDEKPADKAA